MKFISLFAGIGGFDLGLERAGMQCVGQVEIDPMCQQVLEKHWPNVKRMRDIRDVIGNEFGYTDLVCGGYPCQPFSTSGKRKGNKDARYLWPEMRRIISIIKPTWVIGENVAGHITCGFDEVINDLEKENYETRSFVLTASALGAPHERKRVFIVANLRAWNSRSRVESTAEDVYRDGKGEQTNVSSSYRRSGICEGDDKNQSNIRPNKVAWWEAEPGLDRVVYGIPCQPHRFKQLGNSVVPQVVEVIGRAIRRAHVLCAERLPDIKEARLTAYNSAR